MGDQDEPEYATGYISSYLATKGQLKATSENFEKALADLKIQTDSVKKIEENISHDFLEKRESSKIKREKIEEVYAAIMKEHMQFILYLVYKSSVSPEVE